jgi:predicted DNA-binding protein
MRYDEQINFRTTSEIKDRLKSIADSQGTKVSQLVNEIVAAYLSGQSATVTADVTLQKVYEIVISQEKRLETLEKKSAA